MLALRTHFRAQPDGEQVYMYEMDLNDKERRELLEKIVKEADELSREPEFFNTATNNCATKLLDSLEEVIDLPDWHYSFLLNGYLDRCLYDHGFLLKKYDSEPFEDVRNRALLNDYAKKHWRSYDSKRMEDPAYRESSYSELLLKYYGK